MIKHKKILTILLAFFSIAFILTGCSSSQVLKFESKQITNYTIDAVFCDEEKKISAIEQVDYINNTGEELKNVCFNLYVPKILK